MGRSPSRRSAKLTAQVKSTSIYDTITISFSLSKKSVDKRTYLSYLNLLTTFEAPRN